MRRVIGIAVCIGTHILFAYTVWSLFWFLKGAEPTGTGRSLWIDVALALQFAVVHSILLHPVPRGRLTAIIPPPFYGLFFCTMTCLGLLLTIVAWQPGRDIWWSVSGPLRVMIECGFYSSWVMLLYSISLNGLGYQTGWTPWTFWFRRQSIPPRPFSPRRLYQWLRHPVYLSFLGLIWFTPVMSADRAILIGLWTAYIFVGSCLKDQRLVFFLGNRYREYQARVPGYPGMPIGPLARIPFDPPVETPAQWERRAA